MKIIVYKEKMEKFFPPLIYAIISLVILRDFLTIGKYILSLDLVFGPKPLIPAEIYWPNYPQNGLPIAMLVKILSLFLPIWFIEKLWLFLILFFSGMLMHFLCPLKTKSGRYFAGFLYMLNPLTYARFLSGYIGFLSGYALLPLAIRYWITMITRQKKYNEPLVIFVLIATIIGFFSLHILIILWLIISISLILWLALHKQALRMLKLIIESIFLYLLLNVYWLIPLITFQGETILSRISVKDLETFAPHIAFFSPFFTLASMYGFWRVGYLYTKDFLPFWWILFVLIILLSIHGFISYYKHKKLGFYVKTFALIWPVGLILAAGIRSPFTDFFTFLFTRMPLMKGMRDTHKFVTMLCLSYSFLGALGLAEIEKDLENKRPIIRKIVILMILLIPLLYSFTFFNGFAGQIKPTDFPKDWYKVNEFLNLDKDDFKILFFPWHLYMDFHWIPNRDKRIMNPAPFFFDKEIISAKNIEVPGIYRQIYTPYQVYIDYLLSKKNEISNFGELISIIGVKYILLTKEVDYKDYFFLFNQSDLELVKETESFYVFKNKSFKGLIFSVNGTACVKNWNELINVSKTEDITKRLYLVGNGKKEGNEICSKLKYKRVNSAEYIIKNRPLRYIILTEEYGNWGLNAEKPLKAYGVVNAYIVKKIDLPIKIIHKRFYEIYLPSSIISFITFIGCFSYLIIHRILSLKKKIR